VGEFGEEEKGVEDITAVNTQGCRLGEGGGLQLGELRNWKDRQILGGGTKGGRSIDRVDWRGGCKKGRIKTSNNGNDSMRIIALQGDKEEVSRVYDKT